MNAPVNLDDFRKPAKGDGNAASARVEALKQAVQSETNGACIERATLWTQYNRDKKNKDKTPAVKIAEATSHVLRNKSIAIYPQELIVGNFTSKRVAGHCYPELAGIQVMMEVFGLPNRRVNPLEINRKDQFKLAAMTPYWLNKNCAYLAFDNFKDRLRFAAEQGKALEYQVYEAGGIAHLAPDYEKLVNIGA